MEMSIPENGIYGMTDDEIDDAIQGAEEREVILRNFVAELKLHKMMRRHVRREHLRDNIAALQQQLESL